MIYLVDTATVEPADVDPYLETLFGAVVPVMERAGAVFEHCRTTSDDLGRAVDVEVTWSFADNATWNAIRRNLVLDVEWHVCADVLGRLRRSGRRRFLRPVAR
ncbi:MAG TPA: hypothetical protein VE991_11370 [Acidimicrobiales bacterium]|nr:hypothetical protein [Acidimicrobiales bacterium]